MKRMPQYSVSMSTFTCILAFSFTHPLRHSRSVSQCQIQTVILGDGRSAKRNLPNERSHTHTHKIPHTFLYKYLVYCYFQPETVKWQIKGQRLLRIYNVVEIVATAFATAYLLLWRLLTHGICLKMWIAGKRHLANTAVSAFNRLCPHAEIV